MLAQSIAGHENQAYLSLAARLAADLRLEESLPQLVGSLPPLNRERLDALGALSLDACLNQPHLGWAIAAVADAAAATQVDSFMQALAAWYLARAANEWTRPERVEKAARRAQEGFTALGEDGWIAAALWQLNALPWTRNDFQRAVVELDEALVGLEAAKFDQFVPLCRLSLAYAQILTGTYKEAMSNITVGEQFFNITGDQLHLARSHLIQTSSLRRQGRADEALAILEGCLHDFSNLGALIDVAKVKLTRAICRLNLGKDYEQAEREFIAAAVQFDEADLPLWSAQSYNALALLYRDTGQMADSWRALSLAREIYQDYTVLGLRADNLLDSGKFAMYQGNSAAALRYLAQAETLYRRLRVESMIAVATMYQGEAYKDLGRYEIALAQIERARRDFQDLDEPHRLNECEKLLAEVWLQLDRPAEALPLLQRAVQRWQETEATFFLGGAYSMWTEALFRLGAGHYELVSSLEQALGLWQQRGLRSLVGSAHYLLGQLLNTADSPNDALGHLEAAEEVFVETGMRASIADTLVAMGHCLTRLSRPIDARDAWERALALSEGVQLEAKWQAHAGLAQIADQEGQALAHYRHMSTALGQLRRLIWQPAVADAYLRRPSAALDNAVKLAAKIGSSEDALLFMEESRAQILDRQPEAFTENTSLPRALRQRQLDLTAEIRWLQEQLRIDATHKSGRLRPAPEGELRQRLRATLEAYDRLMGEVERARWSAALGEGSGTFTLESFRETVCATLGENWLALNYYLTDETLVRVAMSPLDASMDSRPVTGRERILLRLLSRSATAETQLRKRDLVALGNWLLPEAVLRSLRPDTTLIIIPHRVLSHLPWPALAVGAGSDPLVTRCVPIIVPSLQSVVRSATRIEQRTSHCRGNTRRPGVVVAISDFQGRREPLPHVTLELETLAAQFGPDDCQLVDAAGTWRNLLQLSGERKLADFHFLHVASHAFHDHLTGRLSGLAFYDRDVWLDELTQCAPWPPLVILSACSGLRSRLYEGDERGVGLAATFLRHGSRQVIGSLGPIRDEDASALMLKFYDYYFDGCLPAEALALAQRDALENGLDVNRWSAVQCIGLSG